MSTTRYIFGVLVVTFLPPAVLWWFLIHPFVDFWRGVGARITLTVMSILLLAGMAGLFAIRAPLMGSDLGTSWILVGFAGIFLVASIWIALARRRHLTFRILAGVPELEAGGKGGALLTEGAYSVIRHPRYVEIAFGTIAYALFANWTGPYVVTALTILGLHAVVVLEERELARRFGDEYDEYRKRVPRYLPRLR